MSPAVSINALIIKEKLTFPIEVLVIVQLLTPLNLCFFHNYNINLSEFCGRTHLQLKMAKNF